MSLAHVLNTGSLKKFLELIQTAQVPSKVDATYLKAWGFTGKNEQYLIAFLKHIGFTDSSSAPTQRWHDHRHAGHEQRVRADGVREAYEGFFDVYSDAQARTEQEFTNWARTEEPSAAPTTIKRAWSTFKVMVAISDFGAAGQNSPPPPKADQEVPAPLADGSAGEQRVQLGSVGPITINIELQLPATADAAFFEQFFSSMRKHLIDDHD